MARKINITVMIAVFLSIALCLPAAASYLPFNTNVRMNVGIGSANPGQSLDVQGTVRATAFIGNGSGLSNLPSSTLWTTTNTNDVYLPNSGNVGIGTTITSAGAALSVMNGNVGIGTWVPSASLTVAGAGLIKMINGSNSFTVDANVSSGTTDNVEFKDLVSSGGYTQLGIWGASTTTSTYYVTRQGTSSSRFFYGLDNGGLGRINNEAGDIALFSGVYPGTERMRILSSTGDVGIGTSSPGSSLSVLGGESLGSYATTTAPPGGIIASGNVGIGTWVPGGALMVNGNVGIGTFAPIDPFSISISPVANSTHALLNLSNTPLSGASANGTYLGFNTSGGADYINFQFNGGSRLRMAGSGDMTVSSTINARSFEAGIESGLLGGSDGDGLYFTVSSKIIWNNGGNYGVAGDTGLARNAAGVVEVDNGTIGTLAEFVASNVGIGTVNADAYTLTTPAKGSLIVEKNIGIGTYVPNNSLIVATGNVGIGSAFPGQTLDVQGTVRSTGFVMSGQGPSSGYVLTAIDGTGNATWTAPGSISGAPWTQSGTNIYTSGSNNVGIGTTTPQGAFVVTNGNVGIGTWVAGSKLTILGAPQTLPLGINPTSYNTNDYTGLSLNNKGAIFISDTNPNYSSWGRGDLIFALNNQGNANTAGSSDERVRITADGYVGIGTTSPQGQLIVINGNVGIGTWIPVDTFQVGKYSSSSKGFMIDSNGNVGIGTTITSNASLSVMNGSVGIGTWIPSSALAVTGNATVSGNITSTGTITGNTFVSGSGGGLGFKFGGSDGIGDGFGWNDIVVSGNSGWYLGSAYNTNLTQTLNMSKYALHLIGTATTSPFAIGLDNNTNPTLAVINTLQITGNVGIGTSSAFSKLNVNGGVGIGTTLTNNAYISGNIAPSGGLIVQGNVGIGTFTPTQALEVNGYILADVQYNYPAGFGALADNGGNLHVPEALLDSGDSPGTSGECLTTTGTQVAWGSCSGNVGVGTGFPSSPLQSVQFNNNGNFGGSSNFVFNGTNVGIGTVLSKNTLDIGSNVSIGTAYAGYQVAPSNGLIVQGNVGVGTFAPVKPFSVTGDTYHNGNVGIGTSTTTQGALVVTNGNVGIGTWAPGGALTVMGGNVGIGTTIPHGTLQVVGGQVIIPDGTNAAPGLVTANSGAFFAGLTGTAGTISLQAGGNNFNALTVGSNGNATVLNLNSGQGWPSSANFVGINPGTTGSAVEKAILQVNGTTNTITGAYATERLAQFNQSTITAASALSISSEADTVNIAGPVISAGSASILNSVALRISSGSSVASGVTNSYGLYVSAPTGATNNYGAVFNTGNVGIGTFDPLSQLNVNGGVGIGTSLTNGNYLNGNSAPSGGLIVQGNVGLGTYAPTGALEVEGNVGIGTAFTTTSALAVMNGNVGIGTWIPNAPLSLGNSATSGNMMFNGPNGTAPTSINIAYSQSLFGGDVSGLNFSSTSSRFAGINIAGSNGSTSLANGVINTSWNGPNSATPFVITRNGSARIAFFDDVNLNNDVQFQGNGSENLGFMSFGNVGIGTDAAVAKLAIVGNIGIGTGVSSTYIYTTPPKGGMIVEGNVGIGTYAPTGVLEIEGGNVGIGTAFTTKAALTVMNGNVGIGTWLPSSSLQVVGGGIQVGLPTGGDKGSGNINIAGDIYKNNAAYTNPDYVFEKYFTGNIIQFKNNPGASTYQGIKPISDVMTFTKLHHQLPLVSSVNGRGLFGKGDGLLASLEESYIYIFDLNNQQKKTNDQIKVLQQENEDLRMRLEELEKKMQSQQTMGNGMGNALPKYKQSLEKESTNRRTL